MKHHDSIVIHRILATFEKLSQELQKLGVSKKAADRNAMRVAFLIEAWPTTEAEDFVETHMEQHKHDMVADSDDPILDLDRL